MFYTSVLQTSSPIAVLTAIQAAVVPKQELFTPGTDVGLRFFELTLGQVVTDQTQLTSIWSGLKATSAMGNIIVVTFVAARGMHPSPGLACCADDRPLRGLVKQEIAKEGVLPFSLTFAQNYDFSLSRLFGCRPANPGLGINLHSEKTPAATLALHWFLTNTLVLATVFSLQPQAQTYDPTPAYTFLVSSYTYVVDIACFAAMGLGLLCLRLTPSLNWASKSQFRHQWVSTLCAAVLFLLSVVPLVLLWVPDPGAPFLSRTDNLVPWYAPQTLGVCAIAGAFLYWLGFRAYVLIRSRASGLVLKIERHPIFKDDKGRLTQIYEIITLRWVDDDSRDIGLQRMGVAT
jgi:hypothetical protein